MGADENGTFEMIDISNVRKDNLVSGLLYVDQIRPANDGVRYKRRLVSQSYSDDQAPNIEKKEPTVQHLTQQLILFITASMEYTSTHI